MFCRFCFVYFFNFFPEQFLYRAIHFVGSGGWWWWWWWKISHLKYFFFLFIFILFYFLSEKKVILKKNKKKNKEKKKFFHMHRSEYISADYKLFNFFLFSDLQVWFWELDNNNNILADCVHVCVCVWVTLGVNVDDDEIVLKSKRKFE